MQTLLLVGELGIEPRPYGPKPYTLPLCYTPCFLVTRKIIHNLQKKESLKLFNLTICKLLCILYSNLLHMKQKKKLFDVGKKVRHISREVFHGKLPCEKIMRDRKKFHKGSRGKNRRVNSSRDYLPFCFV